MADKKISGTHRPHRLTSQEHYSDAFLTSAFLALSGGLQDAYTYNTRDGVFSNAQTGNVVLMSQHLMRGEWGACMRYFVPVIAFALGVFLAERICHRYKYAQKIHWRQLILSIEIVILFAVGFIPQLLRLVLAGVDGKCVCAASQVADAHRARIGEAADFSKRLYLHRTG